MTNKQLQYLLGLLLFCCVASTLYYFFGPVFDPSDEARISRSQKSERMENSVRHADTPRIRIGTTTIAVELATSSEERKKGLSGRPFLRDGTGMLFIFPGEDRYGVWMPEMNFSIDVVWMDSSGVVVALEEGISPETYPQTFVPAVPARYVLELPSQSVRRLRIHLGEQIFMEIP